MSLVYDEINYSVELRGSYTREDIIKVIDEALKVGYQTGMKDCKIRFNSTMKPYEDSLGNVAIYVEGYREKSKEEIEEDLYVRKIKKLSKKLGVTFYEASVLYRNKDKLKDIE